VKALTIGLFLLLTLSVVTVPTVFADEDEWDDDEREYEQKEGSGNMEREQEREHEEDDDDSEDAIESLGWVAIGAGVIANLPFILFNKWRKYAVQAGGQSLQLARQAIQYYKPVLNFHIILNSIGYFAGMTHEFS